MKNTFNAKNILPAFMRINPKKKRALAHKLFNLTNKVSGAIVYLYNHMIRKIALISLWFTLAPTLLILIGLFLTLQKSSVKPLKTTTSFNVTASEPEINNIQAEVVPVKVSDSRPFILEKFLKGKPLAPYSSYIVEVSDKYGIDYRLIPAIAMKESNAGAAVSEKSHNAWGFENGKTYFGSWEEAIDTVGKTLKNRYVAKGLVTPEQIMAVYAPPQLETGGKWAKDINVFYAQMGTL